MVVIENGVAVGMAYQLTDDEGNTLDQSSNKDPFWYLHGFNNIIPGLEKALDGLKPGDSKKVTVQPAEGYGEVDENLRIQVTRDQLGGAKDLQVGMRFVAQLPSGDETVFSVISIDGDNINLDGNHPLAGLVLHFQVEIVETRSATEQEKAHGHIHGTHGHDH